MPLWFAAAAVLVHLQRDGVLIRPGHDDATARTSSIIDQPVQVPAWTVSDEVWEETVACLRNVYAPFDVEITTEDPGDVPHVAGVFGGSPLDFGFPRSNAGMAPFRADCSVIPNAMVFVFTAILPPDPTTACRIMAQEIGHSFGLDHTLAAGDPMSVTPIDGEPMFVDEEVACGEYTARPCGLPGRTCREKQNSYRLLEERIGPVGASELTVDPGDGVTTGGCSTGPNAGGLAVGGAALVLARRRRRASPR